MLFAKAKAAYSSTTVYNLASLIDMGSLVGKLEFNQNKIALYLYLY